MKCGWTVVLLLGSVGMLAARAGATEAKIDFNRDIRPILSDTCFTCHGPDDAKRKSGLRLDQQDSAYKVAKSGKIALVPGDVAKSELVRRITTSDEDDHMPPADSGKQLSKEQIELLKKWVTQGAAYKGTGRSIRRCDRSCLR